MRLETDKDWYDFMKRAEEVSVKYKDELIDTEVMLLKAVSNFVFKTIKTNSEINKVVAYSYGDLSVLIEAVIRQGVVELIKRDGFRAA